MSKKEFKWMTSNDIIDHEKVDLLFKVTVVMNRLSRYLIHIYSLYSETRPGW